MVVGELPAQLPPPRDIDATELIDAFRLGYSALRDVWAWILPPRTILQLKRLADTPAPQFRVPDEIWDRIIYDFALGHRVRALPRDHLLGSLTPPRIEICPNTSMMPSTAPTRPSIGSTRAMVPSVVR